MENVDKFQKQGQDAFMAGHNPEDNPYISGSLTASEALQWWKGYNSARIAHRATQGQVSRREMFNTTFDLAVAQRDRGMIMDIAA